MERSVVVQRKQRENQSRVSVSATARQQVHDVKMDEVNIKPVVQAISRPFNEAARIPDLFSVTPLGCCRSRNPCPIRKPISCSGHSEEPEQNEQNINFFSFSFAFAYLPPFTHVRNSLNKYK
jgi:hypothetical protein